MLIYKQEVTKLTYKLRDKKKRNEEIWEYYKAHPDFTMREMGETFNLSGTRIFIILQAFKEKEKAN
jgi:hypothetical protein